MEASESNSVLEMVNEYENRIKGATAILATSRGSVNYGLYKKGLSDTDTTILSLPSWQDILMGKTLDNKQIIDKDNDIDIHVIDLRNLKNVFLKPNFSNLQLIWGLSRYSFLGYEIDKWIESKSIKVIQENLKPLALSSLGRYRAESKRELTNKELSLHLYNLRLVELLISKKDLSFKEFKEYALTLGTKPYPKTHVSLFDLKFQGAERKFFEEEVARSAKLVDNIVPALPRISQDSQELQELNQIIVNIVSEYVKPHFVK